MEDASSSIAQAPQQPDRDLNVQTPALASDASSGAATWGPTAERGGYERATVSSALLRPARIALKSMSIMKFVSDEGLDERPRGEFEEGRAPVEVLRSDMTIGDALQLLAERNIIRRGSGISPIIPASRLLYRIGAPQSSCGNPPLRGGGPLVDPAHRRA